MKRTVVHISKQFKTQENVLQQSSILFPFLESPILNSTAKKQIRLKKVYGIGNNKNIKSLVPHPEPYHEFVFFGRSNVGKSTLLNQLLQQAVAGVSKQPGKTKELMFCELNAQYKAMMVDAPGYGFATGTSKKEINEWSKLITSYLKLTQPHKKHQQFMCLLDISHGVKESDALLFQLLKSFNKQFMLIFTKCDRMNDDDLHKAIEMAVNIQQQYQQMNFYIHFTSSLTMKGIDELRNHLMFSLVSQYL